MNINISAIDTNRFGFTVAKANDIDKEDVITAIDFCQKQKVKLLIARCNASDIKAVQEMERNGFIMCDTQVGFIRNLKDIPETYDSRIRAFNPCVINMSEANMIKSISQICFKGYHGHYHNDILLDSNICDDIYGDWGKNVCKRNDFANMVYVAEIDNEVVGFMATRMNNEKEAEGVLSAILPEYQGKGIYHSFIVYALRYAKEQGAERFVMSTQLPSIAVQKVWVRLGFEPCLEKSFYTFHYWLKEKPPATPIPSNGKRIKESAD